jgi:catechol 2,3-dioxygenase-like lactoylglutathione lyase family enzyme
MGVHHVALATRDLEATHRFYTEVMGFELVKVEAAPTDGGGWARHVFYDTHGQGMVAFWDIHGDENVAPDFPTSISKGLGLPVWTNHLAFDAGDLSGIEAQKRRWLDAGHDVVEIDHGWCTSIYLMDPNGILVEFCATTRPFTDADRKTAQALLAAEKPSLGTPAAPVFHEASKEGSRTS